MNKRNIYVIFLVCLLMIPSLHATESIHNLLMQEQNEVRYAMTNIYLEQGTYTGDNIYDIDEADSMQKRKSPTKAFVLSLLVPGLGQFYNGNKIKPIAFIGIEVTSWVLYSKWQSKGDDLTVEFEAFHDQHWDKSRYEDKYLLWVYGETDDDLITAQEVSHHLPDTKTQQYYEMTGKYDQFAWGWDDAELNGNELDDYNAQNPPPRINNSINTPYSANRIEIYEPMRKEADDNYRKANRMIIMSVANHVLSAFEAFITAKKYNNKLDEQGGSILTKINIKPSIRSYNYFKDTPYLTLTYKF